MELQLTLCERKCLQEILELTIQSFIMAGACHTVPDLLTRLSLIDTRLFSPLLVLDTEDVFELLDALRIYKELQEQEEIPVVLLCVDSVQQKLVRLYEYEHFRIQRKIGL